MGRNYKLLPQKKLISDKQGIKKRGKSFPFVFLCHALSLISKIIFD